MTFDPIHVIPYVWIYPRIIISKSLENTSLTIFQKKKKKKKKTCSQKSMTPNDP